VNCHLCLERVPMERIADHMRLIHPTLVWHGDDPSDARADAWDDGRTVVHQDCDEMAEVIW
jgi:hypothetical protein